LRDRLNGEARGGEAGFGNLPRRCVPAVALDAVAFG
jgi:hypothetical protein